MGGEEKRMGLSPRTVSAYNNLGIAYSRLGRYEEGERFFRQAIDQAARWEPKLAEPLNNLGVLYARRGKHKEALALFLESIRINPNDARAYAALEEVRRLLQRDGQHIQ